ncbi:MAG: hypothetical protein B7Z75_02990 [Acidocella sp. 20-57-95]|nr:MAG: hypothetical protein B7Z75_02990 [Acidocella sp. 20-57-95]OYV58431.1 MAG: hypothetical protein B7Z71_10260 [Acidocella sp. 21-58-7]HQT64515.1 DUF2007 domain-containing protein [Acidocella sp.]HQU04464.1 DUF2007 domain-containing protein [Acidocella sp.]
MEMVIASNEPVRLSFLMALLRDAGLEPVLYDANMAVLEGSAGAIQRRVMVPSDQASRARRVLQEAGEL